MLMKPGATNWKSIFPASSGRGSSTLGMTGALAPGENFAGAIDESLNKADIVLLLVSPDFLASDYCYEIEMKRALARHASGKARVIPVILRPCDWHYTPFGTLQAVPKDAKPITSWADHDEAFLDVVKAIKAVLPKPMPVAAHDHSFPKSHSGVVAVSSPRSSNLRVRKQFTQADKDHFLEEVFAHMAAFFENSLAEPNAETRG